MGRMLRICFNMTNQLAALLADLEVNINHQMCQKWDKYITIKIILISLVSKLDM